VDEFYSSIGPTGLTGASGETNTFTSSKTFTNGVGVTGGSLGIGTASPATKLDVNGDAQFGSGATKSTFTTTGDLLTAGKVYVSTTASGNGNLRVRAGTGNGGGTTPIILFSWVGSSTTQGGGPGTIIGQKFTIPGNTLVNDGDWLEVFCLAKATTTSVSKILSVTVDGDQDGTGSSTSAARQWTNKSIVTRTTSTNLMHHAERERGDPSGSAGQSVDIDYTNTVAVATSFSVSCDIRADNNNTAAGDEVMDLKQMTIVYHPAP